MEKFRKKIALLMAVVMMVVSTQIQAFATTDKKATQTVTGDITLSVVFGYNVGKNKLDSFKMGLELTSKTNVNSSSNLKETGTPQEINKKGGLESVVFEKDGNSIIQISMKNKEIDTYKLSLSSNGYKTYTEDIELKNNNKHIVLYTDGKDFTSGDFNKDGKVDEEDIKELKGELNTNNNEYDLDGDGNVDIVELSQVYWGATATKPAEVRNTSVIMEKVIDAKKVEEEFKKENKDVKVEGEIGDLFSSNEETKAVTFKVEEGKKITEENPIKIPVINSEGENKPEETIKVSNVVIKTPENGAINAGYVNYTDISGNTKKVPFNTKNENQKVVSSDTNTILLAMADEKATKSSGTTIVINIGNQVPIQKITIEVTDVNDGIYASISKIEFLEDVLEDSINQEQSIIKNFRGIAKDGSVQLSWNKLSNISGYEVSYGMEKGVYTNTKPINTPNNTSTTITGLENDKKYYFTVRAIGDNDYKGPFSNEIILIPFKQKPPGAPTGLNVESLNEMLKVTFVKHSDAKSSTIYYRKKGNDKYDKIENVSSGYIIRGLTNGVEYEIRVTGTNEAGEGASTQTVVAMPKKDEIKSPMDVPTHKQIPEENFKIELIDKNSVDESEYGTSKFNISYLTDKNYHTHYTSNRKTNEVGIRVTFDKATDMDYLAYVTRLDRDENGQPYSTYAQNYRLKILTGSNETIEINSQAIPTKHTTGDKNGLMILPIKGKTKDDKDQIGKINVKEMEIYLTGKNKLITMSEIMFYKYDPVIDELTALFNDSFTQLKANVTSAEVSNLLARIEALSKSYLMINSGILFDEIDLANELINNSGSTTVKNRGTVIDVDNSMKASSERDKQIAMSLSNLQPTGVTIQEGDTIVVYADFDKSKGIPEVVFSNTVGKHGKYLSPYKLKKGRNIITVPDVNKEWGKGGGSIYVRYDGSQENVKIQLRGTYMDMKKAPMLDIKEINESNENKVKGQIRDYVDEISLYNVGGRNNYTDVTEIALPNVLLSLTANEVKKVLNRIQGGVSAKTDMLYNTFSAWEKNMKLYYDLLGFKNDDPEVIHRPPTTRPNIRAMTIEGGVFMYATSGHIGIPVGAVGGLVNGETVNSADGLFGWGVNHELGHVLNNNSYVIAEITNNIFPLYSQTINGGRSRLEPTVAGGTDGRYESNIYKKVTSGETGFVADTWTTLGMFWQLHLGLDKDPKNITEFYSKLHKEYRKGTFAGDSKWDRFMKISAKASGKDLTEFFKAWGLLTDKNTSVLEEMVKYKSSPAGKIQYVNDDAYRYMIKGGKPIQDFAIYQPEIKVIKEKQETSKDMVVKISLPPLKENQLGYEIIRKEKEKTKVIGFTTKTEFIDDTVMNNRDYTYSVVAYDNTLQESLKSTEKTIRIDVSEVYIEKSNLEFTKDNVSDKVTITVKDNMLTQEKDSISIIGIKFKKTPTNIDTQYKVTISSTIDDKNGIVEKDYIAKDSTNPDGSVYFNKPNTNDTDMRIWTYDATKIVIEGANIDSLEDIEILAYPGDTVQFTLQGGTPAIGYSTQDIASTEIKAGDLIMVGTYTGHPVYSKVILSAEYVPIDASDKRPNLDINITEKGIDGVMYMNADLPTDNHISKVKNGIWIFRPAAQPPKNQHNDKDGHFHQNINSAIPQKIRANIFRQDDDATSTEGGRLISDTPWIFVPEELPNILIVSGKIDIN